MELYEFIGRQVRSRRRDLGLTQRELAASAEITRPTVANLERGQQLVPLHHLVRIARALRLDYRELLPPPEELEQAPAEPVTAESVRERAPVTAALVDRLRSAISPDDES